MRFSPTEHSIGTIQNITEEIIECLVRRNFDLFFLKVITTKVL
jgi:hypothetical protein